MTKISSVIFPLFLLASIAFIAQQQPPAASPRGTNTSSQSGHRLAQSMQAKIDHIQENAQRPTPDQTPTVMTEEEINDYIATGGIVLPKGVKKLRLQGTSGVITAFLNVDFDEIRAGQNSLNPMLSVFSGQHDVVVEADAAASGGRGKVHIREVSIDGITVPHVALEYFVSKYIAPKYPNIGLDSEFQLTYKIDTSTVGYHKLTVTQK
ncbi:MAG TPA: hypothetical protein VFT65_15705 [Candidatus Angelobacter sp.]|nr:hypothetical protein [Candidatus Angelobacter sp.]